MFQRPRRCGRYPLVPALCSTLRVTIPSIHVVGLSDEVFSSAELLELPARNCKDPSMLFHPGGHVVPLLDSNLQRRVSALIGNRGGETSNQRSSQSGNEGPDAMDSLALLFGKSGQVPTDNGVYGHLMFSVIFAVAHYHQNADMRWINKGWKGMAVGNLSLQNQPFHLLFSFFLRHSMEMAFLMAGRIESIENLGGLFSLRSRMFCLTRLLLPLAITMLFYTSGSICLSIC